jgi:SpoVK/Ycf46/Vps4 family AAA+-type ATPase
VKRPGTCGSLRSRESEGGDWQGWRSRTPPEAVLVKMGIVSEHTRGVYLFDEFDAIGSMRANTNDVGEIRRVLNSFLQFLEQDDSESLIVAATNLEDLLDEALFRRFDDVIRYQLPKEKELRDLIANRLAAFQVDRRAVEQAAEWGQGMSHAEVCRACDEAAKITVLDDRRGIDLADLQRTIQLRQERNRTTK